MIRPVNVDSVSAIAVAAKNIFVGSGFGGWEACVAFGLSGFGPSGLGPSGLAGLAGAAFRRGK